MNFTTRLPVQAAQHLSRTLSRTGTFKLLCFASGTGPMAKRNAALLEVVLVVLAMAAAQLVAAGNGDSVVDFCVADFASPSNAVGAACKKVADVVPSDFKFTLTPAVPAGRYKFGATTAFAAQWPAVNGLSASFARVDFAQGGLVPAHTHPRATELMYVLQGSVLCAFVASDGTLYQEVVQPGQLFVVPRGLIHLVKNVGNGPAVLVASFNSQNPGLQLASVALLASSPRIASSIVAQDWNIKSSQVDAVSKAFWAQ